MSDVRMVFPGNGLQKLSADLRTASGRVGAKASKAIRQGAARIERDAKAAAPRRSGALAASIGTTFAGSGRGEVMSATVMPSARYAPFVEFGTYKDAAQPFLFPALDRHEGDVLREVAEAADEILP